MKEANWKGNLLYSSHYMTLWERKTIDTEKGSVIARVWWGAEGWTAEHGGVWGAIKILCDTIMMDVLCLVAQSCPTLCDPVGSPPAPLSMGFSRQDYWSGLPYSPPGDLPHPDPGIKPMSPHCRHILYHLSHQGSPFLLSTSHYHTIYLIYIPNRKKPQWARGFCLFGSLLYPQLLE